MNAAGAVLTGMASSNKFGIKDGLILEDPVHLFFSMNYADKTRKLGEEVSSAILYTTFNTFGKVNDISSVLYLNFEFTKTDGTTQIESIDITDVFKTQLAKENQWLFVEKEIIIEKPDGTTEGLGPIVGGWDDIESDIVM